MTPWEPAEFATNRRVDAACHPHGVTDGDSIILGNNEQSLKAVRHGDTITGAVYADGKPTGRRWRLVPRKTPIQFEKSYELWPGAVSDSQYAVTEDTPSS